MKVIDLEEYKKGKNLKWATSTEIHVPLHEGEFYKNKDLPLWIHVLGLSIPSLFGGSQMIIAQAHDGKILCFEFGEEEKWEPVSFNVFDAIVTEHMKNNQPDPPEAS